MVMRLGVGTRTLSTAENHCRRPNKKRRLADLRGGLFGVRLAARHISAGQRWEYADGAERHDR